MSASPSSINNTGQISTANICPNLRPVSEPSDPPALYLVAQEGQLQVHTSKNRGSFSGALSEALRSAGLGRKVLVAQFLKGGVSQGPKKGINLCGKLNWLRPEIPCCITDPAPEWSSSKEKPQLVKAVEDIWEVCKERLLSKELDQVVLDELGLAIQLGFLNKEEVICTLEQRPPTMDVILTGPAIPSKIISMANQVTEFRFGN